MNPNEKEVETCASLISYCNKLKQQKGLVPASSEEVAKEEQTKMMYELTNQNI